MEQTIGLLFFLQILTCIQGGEYNYIGCFKDKKHPNRALAVNYMGYFVNSIDYCMWRCEDGGYRYFGLAEGFQCWCGNSGYDRYGESHSCFYPCTGNISQICGGRHRNSVYEIVYPPPPAGTMTRSVTSANVAFTTSRPATATSTTRRTTAATPMTAFSPTKILKIPSLNTATPRSSSNVAVSTTLSSSASPTAAIVKEISTSDPFQNGDTALAHEILVGISVSIGIAVGAAVGCAIIVLVAVLTGCSWSRVVLRTDFAMEDDELHEYSSSSTRSDESVKPPAGAGTVRYTSGVYNACRYTVLPQRPRHVTDNKDNGTVLATSTEL